MATPKQTGALLETFSPFPPSFVAGEGAYLRDDAGQAWLDLYGGHCVAATGHSHPEVAKAVADQARRLMFYSTAARIPVRHQAAEMLADFAPAGLERVFFVNSGAEATENALRLAAMITGRSRFVGFDGAFHGRSQLALSVSDSPGLHARAPALTGDVEHLPFNDIATLRAVDLSEVAAVIVEPVQSMAGVRSASQEWLQLLRQRCTAAGTLLIFDEIQTGMGRMGAPFAADYFGVVPDMLACAKGLGSGFPVAALLMNDAVASELRPGDLGSTFGGGPMACAAVLATIGVILDEGLMDRALDAESEIRRGLEGSVVREIRGRGLLLGLEVGEQAASLKDWLQSQRILIGGSADPDILRLMPPLNLAPTATAQFISAVHSFSAELEPCGT